MPLEVSARKGCIGTFQADHFPASFGAVGQCAQYRVASARTAHCFTHTERRPALGCEEDEHGGEREEKEDGGLASLPVMSACCTGQALCGDFGNDATQQWMILGGLSNMVTVAERLATRWQAGVLVDAEVHSAVSEATECWACRLRDHLRYAKRGSKTIVRLWQILWQKDDGGRSAKPAFSPRREWMYQLPVSRDADPWCAYNEAAKLSLE
eukprot:gene12499-biopygen12901